MVDVFEVEQAFIMALFLRMCWQRQNSVGTSVSCSTICCSSDQVLMDLPELKRGSCVAGRRARSRSYWNRNIVRLSLTRLRTCRTLLELKSAAAACTALVTKSSWICSSASAASAAQVTESSWIYLPAAIASTARVTKSSWICLSAAVRSVVLVTKSLWTCLSAAVASTDRVTESSWTCLSAAVASAALVQ